MESLENSAIFLKSAQEIITSLNKPLTDRLEAYKLFKETFAKLLTETFERIPLDERYGFLANMNDSAFWKLKEYRYFLLGELLLVSIKNNDDQSVSLLINTYRAPVNYRVTLEANEVTPLRAALESEVSVDRDSQQKRMSIIEHLLQKPVNGVAILPEATQTKFEYEEPEAMAMYNELRRLVQLKDNSGLNKMVSLIKGRLEKNSRISPLEAMRDTNNVYYLKHSILKLIFELAQSEDTRKLSTSMLELLKDIFEYDDVFKHELYNFIISKVEDKAVDADVFKSLFEFFNSDYGLDKDEKFLGKVCEYFGNKKESIQLLEETKFRVLLGYFNPASLSQVASSIVEGMIKKPDFSMKIFRMFILHFKPNYNFYECLQACEKGNDPFVKICLLALANNIEEKLLIEVASHLRQFDKPVGVNHLQFLAYLGMKAQGTPIGNNADAQRNFEAIVGSKEENTHFLYILDFAISTQSRYAKIAQEYLRLFSYFFIHHEDSQKPENVDFGYFEKLSILFDQLVELQKIFSDEKVWLEKFQKQLKKTFEQCLNENSTKLYFSSDEAEVLRKSEISSGGLGSTRRKISAMVQPNIGTSSAASFSGSRPVDIKSEISQQHSSNLKNQKSVGGNN